MAERLAKVLEKLSREGKLDGAANMLEKAASTKAAGDEESSKEKKTSFKSVPELVAHYQRKQTESRTTKGKKENPPSSSSVSSSKSFALIFAQYRRSGRFSYKMVQPGKQSIPGFQDSDTHLDVIHKGARGLKIGVPAANLSLIVSGGLVLDDPLPNGEAWTLGGYVREIGGPQIRGKRTFGILLPHDEDEEEKNDDKVELESKEQEGPLTTGRKRKVSQSADVRPAKECKPSRVVDVSLGSDRHHPLTLDSDEDDTVKVDFGLDTIIPTYWPSSTTRVFSGVTATGREGVWRLLRFDYRSPLEAIVADMETDHLQPESEGFFLVGLQADGVTYLQVRDDNLTDKSISDLTFSVFGNKVTHSSPEIQLDRRGVPLVVISPNHGRVVYSWERKQYLNKWSKMDVPDWTCLLYIDTPGEYRCTIEDYSITFHVKAPQGSKQCIKQTGSDVDYEAIVFGDLIGRGSFGAVHKGTWKDETVALKRIPIPPGMDRTQIVEKNQELAALRLVKHPNIITLLGYAVSAKEVVIIMNYVAGKSLDALIFGATKAIANATDDQRLSIARKIASAVGYMHGQNPIIIHQDLKPQNVMVTDDLEEVYVCDFGIAKLREKSQVSMTTVAKGPMGTIPYMAPEMFTQGHRGPAVDIYSLGCLYIELFGYKRVWRGLTGIQVMQKVCGSYTSPPVGPTTSHLPTTFRKLCDECCKVDAKQRPSIIHVIQLLQNC